MYRIGTVFLLLACGAAAATPESALAEDHAKLAAEAEKAGLREEASLEARAALRLAPDHAAVKALLEKLGPVRVIEWPDALHARFVGWSKKRAGIRMAGAKKLATAATAAEKAGNADEAKRLRELAIAEDPDCAEARKAMGMEKVDVAGWVTKEEAAQRRKGLLPVGAEWLPAKDAAARHGKWAEAWEVRSAHFLVRTNTSEKEGLAMAVRAEELLVALRRELDGLTDPLPPPAAPYEIHFYAARADLDAHIDTVHAGKAFLKSMGGFYSPQDKTSHFCPPAERSISTLDDLVRHEATHHLLSDLWPNAAMHFKPGFWAWEGIACYFETIEVRDGKILTGRASHARLVMAKDDMQKGKFKTLEELAAADQNGLGSVYEQSAALAHFFMHSEGGKKREKFVEYLKIVSKGDGDAGNWEKCFGKKPADMQAEWLAYLKGLK
ncbi:MAG: hypothetical protein FD180_3891 [Planctomycetota bacterium]|nr:MAG: hypothetical protein FD180_3891 [Planctomycetota bacterium]